MIVTGDSELSSVPFREYAHPPMILAIVILRGLNFTIGGKDIDNVLIIQIRYKDIAVREWGDILKMGIRLEYITLRSGHNEVKDIHVINREDSH